MYSNEVAQFKEEKTLNASLTKQRKAAKKAAKDATQLVITSKETIKDLCSQVHVLHGQLDITKRKLAEVRNGVHSTEALRQNIKTKDVKLSNDTSPKAKKPATQMVCNSNIQIR